MQDPTSGALPAPGRDLILPVHLAIVLLLGVATILLLGIPSGASDCCGPVAGLGFVSLGELVAVLFGIAIAGTTGRHSPLALVDAVIATPLVAFVPTALSSRGGFASAIPLAAAALLIAGLVGALLAARVVRPRRIERTGLAAAIVLLAGIASAVPAALIVPFAVLAALAWSPRGAPWIDAHDAHDADAADGRELAPEREPTEPDDALGASPVTARLPAPGPQVQRSAATPIRRRRGAPDAAAILGARREPPPGGTDPP